MSQPADSSPVAQALLRSVLDGFPDGLLVVAAEDRVVYLNGAAAAWLGQPRAALLDQPLGALLPGPAVGRVERVTPDGDRRTAAVRSQPVEWDGRPARLLSLQDTTSQVAVQHRLRLLVTAVEQAPDPVLVTNADGLIEYVNPAFETVTGYAASEVIGQTPRILKSGEHDEAFYGQLWSTLKAGEVWRGQFHNRRRDGSLVHEEAVISPLRAADGEIVSFVAVLRDLTEQIELAEQLRQAVKMEAVGQLAAGVAHDFNNLLATVLGYTDLVLEALEPGHPAHDDLLEIRSAAEQAAGLTGQLLVFSRKDHAERLALDLNDLLAALRPMLAHLLGEEIELVVELAAAPAAVQANRSQLEQAVLDLAANAREAMPSGGRFTLRAGVTELSAADGLRHGSLPAGAYVLLRAEDTGQGIDAASLDRVFEPFFTTKHRGRGTGLGLATTYGLVRRSGGHIEVESAVGQGTTFSLYLPLVAAPEPVSARLGAEPPAVPDGGSILLVEDEDSVRQLAQRVLEEQGYWVLATGSPREALDTVAARAVRFDLLLTDVVMPGLSGVTLAEQVRHCDPTIRVVFMSGYADEALARHGLSRAEVPLLAKPFTPRELLHAVRRAQRRPASD